jgi:arylsulfatase A-like enzyme
MKRNVNEIGRTVSGIPRQHLRWAGALVMAMVWGTPAALAQRSADPRPNIVSILLDNIGQEWFGCYGSEENCTPNIDRLAASGVRFANCYTTTVCGPARVQLLTGRYPFRTGWYLHHDAGLYSGGGFDWEREITIARVLRDAGYATGIAGKWQVNNLYDQPDALQQHGFQESLAWPGSIDRDKVDTGFMARFQDGIRNADADFLQEATRTIESRYWDPVMLRNGRREVRKGKYGPDEYQAFAIEFMQRHRDRPFFLYHSVVLAHGSSAAHAIAMTPDNRERPPATDKEAYAAMVRYADRQVGELVAALDQLGLRDNTLVFIAADNGTEASLSGRRNGRMVKGGLYAMNEAGANVALLANSPRLIPGGRVGGLVDFSDIFPTLCDVAKAPPPPGVVIDGRSFAGFLSGKDSLPRSWIFGHYHPDRVVRDTRFKLWSNGRLYDVAADPGETRPLVAGEDPEADRARARLQAVLDSMPGDTPLPFPHRSLSAFRHLAAQRKQ